MRNCRRRRRWSLSMLWANSAELSSYDLNSGSMGLSFAVGTTRPARDRVRLDVLADHRTLAGVLGLCRSRQHHSIELAIQSRVTNLCEFLLRLSERSIRRNVRRLVHDALGHFTRSDDDILPTRDLVGTPPREFGMWHLRETCRFDPTACIQSRSWTMRGRLLALL